MASVKAASLLNNNGQPPLQVVAFCNAAAAACAAHGAAELVPRVSALAAADAKPLAADTRAAAKLLQNLARPFIAAFFPAYAALPLLFNTIMVLVGPAQYHTPCLLILKSLFQASNLDLGTFGRTSAHVSCLKTLVLLLEGASNAEVLEGLDVVLEHLARTDAGATDGAQENVPRNAGGGARGQAHSRKGSEWASNASVLSDESDARQLLSDFIPIAEPAAACAAMAAALQRCVHESTSARQAGRASGGWAQRSRFLPFVQ